MKKRMKKWKVWLLAAAVLAGAPAAGSIASVTEAEAAAQIKLSAKTVTVNRGFTCTLQLKNASGKAVKWKTSNSKVASIKADGTKCVITGKKRGTAVVKATAGNKTYSCRVKVVNTAALSERNKSISKGKTFTLSLKNSSKSAVWSVSNKKILKIVKLSKNTYRIKGLKAGSAYVTAKAGGKSYRCRVTVKNTSASVAKIDPFAKWTDKNAYDSSCETSIGTLEFDWLSKTVCCHFPDLPQGTSKTFSVYGKKIKLTALTPYYAEGTIPEALYSLVLDSKGRQRCQLPDGTYLKNCGIGLNGKVYYFDKKGYGQNGVITRGSGFILMDDSLEGIETRTLTELCENGVQIDKEDQEAYGKALLNISPVLREFKEDYADQCTGNLAKVLSIMQYFTDKGFSYKLVDYSIEEFWEKKAGKCAHYAEAVYEMCCVMGIPVVQLSSEKANHTWNMVYVNGAWRTYDTTGGNPSKIAQVWLGLKGKMRSDTTVVLGETGTNFNLAKMKSRKETRVWYLLRNDDPNEPGTEIPGWPWYTH